MGGKTWSPKEEQVFWRQIIPHSAKRVGMDRINPERTWDELAKDMQGLIGEEARREYTGLGLFEHYFQNAVNHKFSPNAPLHVKAYQKKASAFEATAIRAPAKRSSSCPKDDDALFVPQRRSSPVTARIHKRSASVSLVTDEGLQDAAAAATANAASNRDHDAEGSSSCKRKDKGKTVIRLRMPKPASSVSVVSESTTAEAGNDVAPALRTLVKACQQVNMNSSSGPSLSNDGRSSNFDGLSSSGHSQGKMYAASAANSRISPVMTRYNTMGGPYGQPGYNGESSKQAAVPTFGAHNSLLKVTQDGYPNQGAINVRRNSHINIHEANTAPPRDLPAVDGTTIDAPYGRSANNMAGVDRTTYYHSRIDHRAHHDAAHGPNPTHSGPHFRRNKLYDTGYGDGRYDGYNAGYSAGYQAGLDERNEAHHVNSAFRAPGPRIANTDPYRRPNNANTNTVSGFPPIRLPPLNLASANSPSPMSLGPSALPRIYCQTTCDDTDIQYDPRTPRVGFAEMAIPDDMPADARGKRKAVDSRHPLPGCRKRRATDDGVSNLRRVGFAGVDDQDIEDSGEPSIAASSGKERRKDAPMATVEVGEF